MVVTMNSGSAARFGQCLEQTVTVSCPKQVMCYVAACAVAMCWLGIFLRGQRGCSPIWRPAAKTQAATSSAIHPGSGISLNPIPHAHAVASTVNSTVGTRLMAVRVQQDFSRIRAPKSFLDFPGVFVVASSAPRLPLACMLADVPHERRVQLGSLQGHGT